MEKTMDHVYDFDDSSLIPNYMKEVHLSPEILMSKLKKSDNTEKKEEDET